MYNDDVNDESNEDDDDDGDTMFVSMVSARSTCSRGKEHADEEDKAGAEWGSFWLWMFWLEL